MKYRVIKSHYNRSLISGRYHFKVGAIIEGTVKNGYIHVELRNSTVIIPIENTEKV